MGAVRGGTAVSLHPHCSGAAGEHALDAEAGPGADGIPVFVDVQVLAVIGGEEQLRWSRDVHAGVLQSGYFSGETKIDILPAVAVAVAVESVGPVVGGFVPRVEGDRDYLQICAGHELIQGHAFGYRAINAVISGFIRLSGILLKAADNRDLWRIKLRVEEILRAEADAVLYGFCRRLVEELIGLMAISVGG